MQNSNAGTYDVSTTGNSFINLIHVCSFAAVVTAMSRTSAAATAIFCWGSLTCAVPSKARSTLWVRMAPCMSSRHSLRQILHTTPPIQHLKKSAPCRHNLVNRNQIQNAVEGIDSKSKLSVKTLNIEASLALSPTSSTARESTPYIKVCEAQEGLAGHFPLCRPLQVLLLRRWRSVLLLCIVRESFTVRACDKYTCILGI